MDNVLLTPHIGGSTEEAQENIGIEVASKLIKYSNNGSTLGAVNFPEVSLPEYPGKHRVLHIHRNQPGVLSAINAVFSEDAINIAAEYLQTDAKVGYVVIDMETDERAETRIDPPQTGTGPRHHPHAHFVLMEENVVGQASGCQSEQSSDSLLCASLCGLCVSALKGIAGVRLTTEC